MPFVNDIAGDLTWLTPAPIGYVEAGWVDIVADLLGDIGRAVAAHPTASVDVLDLTERDGALRCDFVVDGVDDAAIGNAIEAALEDARRRAASTCVRCGGPGHLRRDRAAWPTTRCDAHVSARDGRPNRRGDAPGARPPTSHGAVRPLPTKAAPDRPTREGS